MYKDRDIPDIPVGKWAEKYNVPVTEQVTRFGFLPKEILQHSRRAYYAQLAHIDNQIGRLLTSFRNFNETMPHIIFTSDHGELLGDHNLFGKSLPYEGSSRIPLIMFNPESQEMENYVNDNPTVIEDIYPMILKIAGVNIPSGIDGINPLSRPTKREDDSYVHSEHIWDGDKGWQILTDGHEKYIWWTHSGEEQFFDLNKDPNEMNDLANNSTYSKRLKYWRERLIAKLAKRPEDELSDGHNLLPGKVLPAVKPWLIQQSCQKETNDLV
jgi:arylsulfatase